MASFKQLVAVAQRAPLRVGNSAVRAMATVAPVAKDAGDLPASHPHNRLHRPEYLLKFKHYHTQKEMVHYTSYLLAAGVPLTLLLGAPVSSLFDMAFAVAIPLHFHVGLRATLLDYAHFWLSPGGQKACYAVMAGITGLTAFGLVKFNLTDVGITQAVKELFVEQAPPAPKRKLGANPF